MPMWPELTCVLCCLPLCGSICSAGEAPTASWHPTSGPVLAGCAWALWRGLAFERSPSANLHMGLFAPEHWLALWVLNQVLQEVWSMPCLGGTDHWGSVPSSKPSLNPNLKALKQKTGGQTQTLQNGRIIAKYFNDQLNGSVLYKY